MPKRSMLIVKVAESGSTEDRDPSDFDNLDNDPDEYAADDPPRLTPLGSVRRVLSELAAFNTAPEEAGATYLWGPGFRVQMPMTGDDDINQLLVTLTDEDFAWAVLPKMCAAHQWSLMDPDSGRLLRF